MDPQPLKKYNLEDQNKDLKLFMFTVQKGPTITMPMEDFRMIMAYNNEDAINEVRKFYATGENIVILSRFNIELKKIVSNLNLEQPVQVQVEQLPEPPVEKKIENFIFNLKLAVDEYIENKEDKKIVKDILKKIKVMKDEPIQPETKS